MKVIFIGVPPGMKCNSSIDLVYGKTYCVIGEYPQIEGIYYELKGFTEYGYHSKGFIPLSEIDETEMVREKKVNQTLK